MFKTIGNVIAISPVQSGTSAKGEWHKQEFVIEIPDEKYPKNICFTLFNDKNNTLSKLKTGTEVEVSFSVESREYQGRWFSNVNAFRVDVVGDQSPKWDPPVFVPENDDLPF